MSDLKYLYRVLYILINCFFKQVAGIFLKKLTIKSHIITLIIVYNSVVNIIEWLDGSFESQKAQQWFDTRKSQDMSITFLSLKQ